MSKKKVDILYLCDNMACLDSCRESECSHTSNLKHARHKEDLDGRIFEYVKTSKGADFFELDADIYKLEEVSGKTVKELIELFATGWTLVSPDHMRCTFSDLIHRFGK